MARLLLVTSIFPPESGGPATFISALAPALREAGHQVRVFTLWESRPKARPAWLFGLRRLDPLLLRLVLIFFKLLAHVRWAEAVYINGLELPAILACRLARRPAILKIVGDYAWERARLKGATGLDIGQFQTAQLPFALTWQRWLRAVYARLADIIITPSRYLAELVQGWGLPKAKIRVIYNGLTPLPAGWEAKRGGLGDGEKVILTAARLVDWKGIDHLLEALAELTQPARLLILGAGPEGERLSRLARRLGLAGRVSFGGQVSRASVLAAMAQADAFVLASSYEGLPHVLLEAMAAGAPIIAASAGGTPEVVADGRNGLLVPPGRPDLLAQALDRLLADPKLAASLIEAGRAMIGRFAWSQTVLKTAALIEKTCQGRGR